ncbi:hypothetical protein [Pseudonocardia sp. H11422]|uniref:hypothetical protein n=1 Tax=Pseudonocardia sp. H11422 TaxID=2835866 RepID=UPI001BDBDECC|nr:hypothetical protein [Pseudonocardia sp. H11422]
MSLGDSGDGIVRAGEPFGIANEFTGVQVRKVWTKQGERLELTVPRSGYRILLDAMQLEIVAAQDPERFTELFAIRLDAHDGVKP